MALGNGSNASATILNEHDGCKVESIASLLVALNHKAVNISKGCFHIDILYIELCILVGHSHRGLIAQFATFPLGQNIDDVVGTVGLRIEADSLDLAPVDASEAVLCNLQRAYDADREARLLEDPTLLKTPIVRNGKQATVGYRPDVWETWE